MLACLAALFLCCLASEARARAKAPDLGVIVVVHSDSAELHADAVRAALAMELGVPAMRPEDVTNGPVLGTVTVTWRRSRGELAVTYQETGRGAISRVVSAPPDAESAISTATMLTANLVQRDDDLLPPLPLPVEQPPVRDAVQTSKARQAAAAPAPVRKEYLPANASLFYPLATNFGKPDVVTHLDVNLLYGRVGRIDGAQVGVFNHVTADLNGAQVGFGVNAVSGATQGFQVAMGMNLTGAALDGLQASFAFNRAGGHVVGIQGAMGLNLAPGGVDGFEVGSVNVAGDVRGLQLGLLNVGGAVHGVQLGLINVADDVEGAPIGIVSVTKTGGVHPAVWGSNTSFTNVGVKFATKYTYTMVSGSAHQDEGNWLYGPGFTLGAHIPISKFYCEADVGLTWLFDSALHESNPLGGNIALTKLRVLGGYAFYDHLSVFAGVGTTLTARFRTEKEAPSMRLGPELTLGLQF